MKNMSGLQETDLYTVGGMGIGRGGWGAAQGVLAGLAVGGKAILRAPLYILYR